MRKLFIVVTTALLSAGSVAVIGGGGAFGASACPSDPAPGTTISGNLDVTGPCHLDHVTVTGGVTVEPGAGLEMENSRVNGSITVGNEGELDVGHTLGGSTHTDTPNTIGGNVTMTSPIDFDLDSATVVGSVSVSGSAPDEESPQFCRTSIGGNLTLTNTTDIRVGGDGSCGPDAGAGGTVKGSVTIKNVGGGSEVEFARVGPTTVNNTHLGFEGNTVNGSLLCTNGANLHDERDSDGASAPNTVSGYNTCPPPS